MKVQTLVLAASAALILSAQGVAQSDTGLERALTELNAGLTAPAGSASMAISGDARIRNKYTVAGDKKSIDTRARLNFDFNVNESVSVSLGASALSDWDSGSVAATGGNIDRYTVSAANLLGDGGTFTAGTQYFTLGSGRIIGSDDWDQSPSTATGIWYDNGSFNLFFLEGDANDDSYGLTFDYSVAMPGMGDISMRPYILGDVGGEPGSTKFSTNYYGSELSGSAMGFSWSGEYATGGGNTAWTAATSIDVSGLASIPGVSGASLDLSTSTADAGFLGTDDLATLGVNEANGSALTWNQAGYNSNALWSYENVSTAGVSFSPMEGWNGRLARIDRAGDASWNFSSSTTMAGGVDVWVGYDNGDNGEDSFWMTAGINF